MAQDNKGNKNTPVKIPNGRSPAQESWRQINESTRDGRIQGNVTVSETFQPPVKPVTGGGKK